MNTEDTNTAVETPVAKRKGKHVSIIAQTAALAAAIQGVLAPRMKNTTFSVIEKLNERPEGSIIASLGLPSFVPGNTGVQIISLGGRIQDNATKETRKAQWGVLRSETASPEEIMAELGAPQDYLVLPGKVVSDARLALAEARVDIAEAETEAEQLAAYKAGYEQLRSLFE